MSTGKRLAKRSILGTKVMVPGTDDLFHSGVIQAVKTPAQEDVVGGATLRYSVRFEDSPHKVFEFAGADLVGPGFKSVNEVKLCPGQRVYVTHNQREMQGKVVRHDFDSQDVLITIGHEDETLLLKIDDIRLMESRKSARLVNSDTDFSKLADVAISASQLGGDKRVNRGGSNSSKAIEVPRSDYVQIAGSRKRRTSENVADEEEVLSECSAAMLLMKLSCSPHSPNLLAQSAPAAAHQMISQPIFMDLPSPTSSSGASSFRSPTPSPPLSTSTTDEGIVKDLSIKRDKKLVFQCTFPGCQERQSTVSAIECHVRVQHLHRPEQVDSDDEDYDHEEEFYYTEIELRGDEVEPQTRRMASLSLADHLDMARPAHEDPSGPPEAVYFKRKLVKNDFSLSRSLPTSTPINVTIAPSSMGSPGKLIVISPPARSPHNSGNNNGKSPNRRPRDGKKCRKVYGLEQRDQWCTQCKWKKACARFGTNATEPLAPVSGNPQLMPNPATVKAIKF